ncbi:MAG: hypothetical protein QMC68_09470 [Bacteroidia bacterium]|jgi:hypothetical protein
MNEDTHTEIREEETKSKALPVFIFLFLASLAMCAFLFFKYAKNAAKIQQQNEELSRAYQTLDLKADSLQKELDFTYEQLQNKINENLAQEDLKEDLRSQLISQQSALASARRKISKLIAGNTGSETTGGPKNLLEAKNQIATLQKTNTENIAKIELAQKEYAEAKEIAQYNGLLALEFKDDNDSLVDVNTVLEKKLSTASILRIAGLNIITVREKRGKQEITDKASKVERLKISFSVLASDLTVKEKKELTFRIIGPNKAVLTKDTKKLTDSDDLFTLKETITYDGTEKAVTYYYKQDSDYKSGAYKVELLNKGKLLDNASFSLR